MLPYFGSMSWESKSQTAIADEASRLRRDSSEIERMSRAGTLPLSALDEFRTRVGAAGYTINRMPASTPYRVQMIQAVAYANMILQRLAAQGVVPNAVSVVTEATGHIQALNRLIATIQAARINYVAITPAIIAETVGHIQAVKLMMDKTNGQLRMDLENAIQRAEVALNAGGAQATPTVDPIVPEPDEPVHVPQRRPSRTGISQGGVVRLIAANPVASIIGAVAVTYLVLRKRG